MREDVNMSYTKETKVVVCLVALLATMPVSLPVLGDTIEEIVELLNQNLLRGFAIK